MAELARVTLIPSTHPDTPITHISFKINRIVLNSMHVNVCAYMCCSEPRERRSGL